MKRIVKTALMAAAMLLTSCSTSDKSWNNYCQKYGVDPNNPTDKQENFYLDCYCGSVEEECDLSGLVCTHLDTENVYTVTRGVFMKDTYYIFFKDIIPGFKREFVEVDAETAMLVRGAIDLGNIPMKGYLVLNKETGLFNYRCDLKE